MHMVQTVAVVLQLLYKSNWVVEIKKPHAIQFNLQQIKKNCIFQENLKKSMQGNI